ncbi:hypothetical protein CYMTET_42275 [Cymbomonas tetramitiformis]|uniref:Uncharacterized protein n=1 Tax=Cymbomonas tetramitiformis TaxID=36881 RepID=A0AAE0F159_9CHLO|nr:hypothetical protein CYMTET_42275 [Cymbomonas tetramitiformis]
MTAHNRLHGNIRHLISFCAHRGEVAGRAELTVSSCWEARPDGELLPATGGDLGHTGNYGMGPQVGTVRHDGSRDRVWSALLKFAASSQGNQCRASVMWSQCGRGYRRRIRGWAQGAASAVGCGLGGEEVARVAEVVSFRDTVAVRRQGSRRELRRKFVAGAQALGRVGGSGVLWDVGLVVKRWLEWRSSGGRDEPASGTSQLCVGVADADGIGWLSEA